MEEQNLIMDIRERMARLEALINVKLDNTDKRIEQVESMFDKRIEQVQLALAVRIDKLEGTNTWLWRAIVGGFITAAIAIYLRK